VSCGAESETSLFPLMAHCDRAVRTIHLFYIGAALRLPALFVLAQ
jgi:hypothetical protein